MKILVVEDDVIIAMELESLIEDAGHEVVGIADDRASALRLADQADFVFMDGRLRDGLTGPETARILAQDHGKAVYFTTASEEQVVEEVGEGLGGALGLIRKPYGTREIHHALREGEDWLFKSCALIA